MIRVVDWRLSKSDNVIITEVRHERHLAADVFAVVVCNKRHFASPIYSSCRQESSSISMQKFRVRTKAQMVTGVVLAGCFIGSQRLRRRLPPIVEIPAR